MDIKNPKSLNRAILAYQSIRRAMALHPLINIQKDEQSKSVIYSAMSVFYACPFTESNRIGALNEDLIPDEYKSTHEKLMTFRNKVAAHSDGDHKINDEFINQACWIQPMDSEGYVEELYPYPNDSDLSKMHHLLDHLYIELNNAIVRCVHSTEFKKQTANQGKYLISLEKNKKWVTKIT